MSDQQVPPPARFHPQAEDAILLLLRTPEVELSHNELRSAVLVLDAQLTDLREYSSATEGLTQVLHQLTEAISADLDGESARTRAAIGHIATLVDKLIEASGLNLDDEGQTARAGLVS